MKALTKLLIAPLIVFFLWSCSSDDDAIIEEGQTYEIADLVGTWMASEITFSYCGNDMMEPSSIDIISVGATAMMVLESDGSFTLSISLPGEIGQELITGSIENLSNTNYFDLGNDQFYIGDGSKSFEIEVTSENTLTIKGGPETAKFDFNDDGNGECASVTLNFMRA